MCWASRANDEELIPEDSSAGAPDQALVFQDGDDTYVLSGEPLTSSQVAHVERFPTLYRQPPRTPGRAGWAACGFRDGESKLVRNYTDRKRAATWQVGSQAALRCGHDGRGGYGFHHIVERHLQDWQNQAAPARINWRDLAGWSIDWVLWDPDVVRWRPRSQDFCYSRVVYLYKNGNEDYRKPMVVGLGETGRRIKTAFPSRTQCGEGTQLIP